jgi:hypothetical protein
MPTNPTYRPQKAREKYRKKRGSKKIFENSQKMAVFHYGLTPKKSISRVLAEKSLKKPIFNYSNSPEENDDEKSKYPRQNLRDWLRFSGF